LNTLNSIIELSDLESERIKVHNSEIDLTDLVKYLDYSYKKTAEEKNLKLEAEIKRQNLVISSDEKLLEQVIKNLMANAIKYTEKGSIKIVLDAITDESNKPFAVLSVEDTGIGIPNQNREFIFDAFRQSSEGIKRRYEGTGLGLTIAQKMMKLLNGRIELESTEGIGSKFSVYLPLPKNMVISKKETAGPNQISEKKETDELPKLLIVEDYLMNIDIMKYFLNDLAIIRHATSFEETMNLINEQDFDIILMDIILKDSESGLELMKTIRQIKHYKRIPIIAITGYTAAEDQETFITEGFTGFLAKPFDKNQLRDVIIQNVYVH
jgi:CheY-like chemotaxis protein